MLNVARVTAPFFFRRAGNERYLRYLHEVEANQWKSAVEIRELQSQKLRKLIAHAVTNVPYYRDLFAQLGLSAADIQSPADLAQLPPLTKTVLHAHSHALLADGSDTSRLQQKHSSGSTGQRSTVFFDSDRGDWGWAYNTRHNRWAGFDWGVKVGSVFNMPSAPPPRHEGSVGQYWHDAKQIVRGEPRFVWKSPFTLTEDTIPPFLHELARFQPQILLGYSNSLGVLSRYALDLGITNIRPRAVIAGGETLLPQTREIVKEAFGAHIYNRYGTREVDIIASECEKGKLHLNDDNLVIETIDEPDEQPGRVYATDLNNFVMPLIRYDLVDHVTRDGAPCECGRGLSVLKSVDGRRTEILRTKTGHSISGMIFVRDLRDIPALRNFQVRQRTHDHFEISFVADRGGHVDEMFAPTIQRIRGLFGEDTRVDLIRMDEIPKVGTGKFKFITSDVR